MSSKKTSEPQDEHDPRKGPAPTDPVQDAPDVADEALSAEVLLDRLMRLQAEYENYRKRVAREKREWTGRAVEALVLDLLPVLDSFDRALGAASDATNAKVLLDGMDLVKRQLADALAMNGVKPIDAKGELFDPNHHEAFLSRPVEEGEEPGILVEEILTGYRMGDRTIRPTRGIVTVATEQETNPDAGSEDE